MSWSTITIILLLSLLASFMVHVGTIWYMINLLKQVKYYDEELTENITVISNFKNHLKSVYELETFYGDETLRHLLKHAEDLTSVFDQYNLYSDDDTTEELINDDKAQRTSYAKEKTPN
jgi:hypothetical protein